MRKTIFIDTGAFLALANLADQYHEAAVRCFETLRASSVLFVTTNFVLDETYTRLKKKAGLRVAVAFGEKIKSSRQIRIFSVEGTLEKMAWEIFQRYSDQPFSYTDCTSFALMRRRKIREAFTFDKDFSIFGSVVYPLAMS